MIDALLLNGLTIKTLGKKCEGCSGHLLYHLMPINHGRENDHCLGRRSSSYVQAVMWCLEELGISYNRIDAGFTYGLVDSEAYLAMNPNGTVPTIQDGENRHWLTPFAVYLNLAKMNATDNFITELYLPQCY